jgi:hypothetical protein
MPYLEVSLMLPAARHRVVRDSGTEHAAYERLIGSLAHRLIAQLCRDDADPTAIPSLRSIRRLALAAVRPLPFRRGRLAVTQQTALAVWSYWRDLLPRPGTQHRLFGAEVRIGSVRVDLIWQATAAGGATSYFFDEIKTGSWHGVPSRRARAQIDSLVDAGVERFGARFAGVRYLTLSDPAGRYWVTPDGRWTPLSTIGRPASA